jgi:hypothetical protein
MLASTATRLQPLKCANVSAAVVQMVLCKHRMGMICAAGRDHKAATALLNNTKQHYQKQQQDHPLALEADLGLAMAQ